MSEPLKPKPPRRYRSVRELRADVSARDKTSLPRTPVEEALEHIGDQYGACPDSSREFLGWLKGGPIEEPVPKTSGLERRHVVVDPKTGQQRHIETEPGSIPPRKT